MVSNYGLTFAGVLTVVLLPASLAGCGKSGNSKKTPATDTAESRTGSSPGSTASSPPNLPMRPSQAPSGTDRPRPSLPGRTGETGDDGETSPERGVDRGAAMDRFDADGDGRLGKDERLAMRKHRVTVLVESVDGDGSGTITVAEIEAGDNPRAKRLLSRFDEVDTNGDGALSSDEIDGLFSKPRRRRGLRERGAGRRPPPGAPAKKIRVQPGQ